MRHKDNAGNEGVIEPGGIQWMTAGKGIVHSEMPEQQDGMLEGFQLWINLPSSHKMTAPAYQEHDAEHIPTESRNGSVIKVISGKTSQGTTGPVSQPLTDPLYVDVSLQPDTDFDEDIATGHNAFIYVIDGEVKLEDAECDSAQPGPGPTGGVKPGRYGCTAQWRSGGPVFAGCRQTTKRAGGTRRTRSS